MKAIVNSNSLIRLMKLSKSDYIEISVNKNEIKLIGTKKISKDESYQIVINESVYGNEIEGKALIPSRSIKMLDKNSMCVINNDSLVSEGQIIKFNIENSVFDDEIVVDETNVMVIQNFNDVIEVLHSRAIDQTRPVLRSICIDEDSVVALDGYRLSIRKSSEIISENKILIPACICDLLKHFKKEKIATICEDEKAFKICFGWISIIANKVELGKYVNYKTLIPDEFNKKAIVNTEDLLKTLKKIKKAMSTYENSIKIGFSKNFSFIEYKSYEIEVKCSIETKYYGESLLIGMNINYLIEALSNYKNTVEINMNSEIEPILIKDKNKIDMFLPIKFIR